MPARARPHRGSVAGLVAGLALLAGCGAAPPKAPPTGVDTLEIPTPDPQPADFTTRVDNPLLPLTVGSSWRYAVTRDSGPERRPRTLAVSVGPGTRTVAGVATRVVRLRLGARGWEEYFAQDHAGNVWSFGSTERGAAWLAGRNGAAAGLAMPARPRLGDGYAVHDAPGVTRDVVQVTDLDATASVPLGTYDDLLETVTTSDRTTGETVTLYRRGLGPVLGVEEGGGYRRYELVAHQD